MGIGRKLCHSQSIFPEVISLVWVRVFILKAFQTTEIRAALREASVKLVFHYFLNLFCYLG